MSLGKLLGILSPGLSATGLLGKNAQSGGMAALGAMSPLAMLLMHKKGGAAPAAASPNPASDVAITPSNTGVNVAPSTVQGPTSTLADAANNLPAMKKPGMDPAKRQQIAQMLLQFGGNLGGFGAQRYF
jgi:hypothetical protein